MRVLKRVINNSSLFRNVSLFSTMTRPAFRPTLIEKNTRFKWALKSETRRFSSKTPPASPPQQGEDLNEELFWDNLNTSLRLNDFNEQNKQVDKQKLAQAERRVFVLQLRMQYKSKSRQSTTAELQLAESISLVETLRNWRVVDHYIVGMKRSESKEMFGEGNQVSKWLFY